jgi:hypothetical protein
MLRRAVAGGRYVRDTLIIVFLLGLGIYVTGYLLRSAASGEPLRLLGDLLATLGMALWTAVVIYAFIEVLPEARRRSAAQTLQEYEGEIRDEGIKPAAGPENPGEDVP